MLWPLTWQQEGPKGHTTHGPDSQGQVFTASLWVRGTPSCRHTSPTSRQTRPKPRDHRPQASPLRSLKLTERPHLGLWPGGPLHPSTAQDNKARGLKDLLDIACGVRAGSHTVGVAWNPLVGCKVPGWGAKDRVRHVPAGLEDSGSGACKCTGSLPPMQGTATYGDTKKQPGISRA